MAWAWMTSAPAASTPNIVWILVDDMSPDLSCYGETQVHTPNLDRLAACGTLFRRAFVTGPICSISRSSLMTGCYQTTIGCQNHRSGSARFPILLPAGMRPVAQRVREAGYHTSNLTLDAFLGPDGPVSIAKTDYNFVWDRGATYDTNHWLGRRPGQPFFCQVQLAGGKHRGERPGRQWPARVQARLGSVTRTNGLVLPPYLPPDPVMLEDWAQYLDTVRYTDWEVGQVLERLEATGDLPNTVVFFWTDHGVSHVRNKQFLYDGGTRVPLIVAGPTIPVATVREDLVEHIDIAASTLAIAGIPRPPNMEATGLFGPGSGHKEFVFSARDRADETVDRIRSVRSRRFRYIRNYFPTRPYLQPNRYKDEKAVVQAMRRLHAEGRLDAVQSLVMAEQRPDEEFYEVESDPHQVRNLAADATYSPELARHRRALSAWVVRTGDRGREPEPREVYLDYVFDARPEAGKGGVGDVFRSNVDLMLRWALERPMRE